MRARSSGGYDWTDPDDMDPPPSADVDAARRCDWCGNAVTVRAEGLDVERLARAIDTDAVRDIAVHYEPERAARAIAAEYARLAEGERPSADELLLGADPTEEWVADEWSRR